MTVMDDTAPPLAPLDAPNGEGNGHLHGEDAARCAPAWQDGVEKDLQRARANLERLKTTRASDAA
jgi:hypothetical protein